MQTFALTHDLVRSSSEVVASVLVEKRRKVCRRRLDLDRGRSEKEVEEKRTCRDETRKILCKMKERIRSTVRNQDCSQI